MRPLSRFIIVSGSILCLLMPKKISKACGWYVEPGVYRFWILQPGLANVKDLTPFFLASTYLYRDNWQKTPDDSYETNIDEWYEQVDSQATKKDIDQAIYEFIPDEFLLSLDSSDTKNSYVKYLQQPANSELKAYMILCRYTEAMQSVPDYWGERPINDPQIMRLLHTADSLYTKSQTPFVKLRTAFLMMRMHKYNMNNDAVLKTYDSLIAPMKSDSYIKAAALYEKALCAKGPEQDYLLSKVFDMGYRRKYCIVYLNSDSVNQTLKLARNAHERSVLFAMATLNRSGRCLEEIRKIYNADPTYRDLPFLLIREINKTEDWLITSKVTEYDPALHYYDGEDAYNYKQDRQYARDLLHFIETMGKNENQNLIHLLAAHLSMILQDYENSRQHLAFLKSKKDLPANIALQVKVDELLLHVMTQRFDAAAEKKFMQIINTPDSLLPTQDANLMKDQLSLFISKKLMANGEKIKGIMLLSRTNRSFDDLPGAGSYKNVYHVLEEKASPGDYDVIINLLGKKEKTEFEQYVTQPIFGSPFSYAEYNYGEYVPRWDTNKLLDLKASWYIRNDELEKALQILEKLPDSLWEQEPYSYYVNSDPFSINIYKGHDNDKYEQWCNRIEIVKEMIRLQNIAKQDPSKAALCYLQLGNAYFNLTWYGKNWLMVKQWWTSGEKYVREVNAFNDMYYGCTRARDYYAKAAKLAKDKKLASLSSFLASACMIRFHLYRGNDDPVRSDRYKKLLKQKGFDTDFYEELIDECATYDHFRNEVRRMQP